VLTDCLLCFGWCHFQVSECAALKRVVLKGDLPIGVDKRSVDTWMEVRPWLSCTVWRMHVLCWLIRRLQARGAHTTCSTCMQGTAVLVWLSQLHGVVKMLMVRMFSVSCWFTIVL
jgi:hypothetical protein